MNRKQFFRNIVGLVGLGMSMKELASLGSRCVAVYHSGNNVGMDQQFQSNEYVVGVDPYIDDRPGLDGQAFAIKLDRDWFQNDDLMRPVYYYPDRMEQQHLGIDGQDIPQNYISYPAEELNDRDKLEAEEGEVLIYIKERKAFKLFTNEPSRFLSTPNQNWKKI